MAPDMRRIELPSMVGATNQLQIRFPDASETLSQDEEWAEVLLDGEWRRFRLHDYDELYKVPGLYESLYYRALRCNSPVRVVSLLAETLEDHYVPPETLRVLDFGAGNGMVGYELQSIGVSTVVGVDLIPEAKESTLRDRAWCYADYFVADLTALPEEVARQIRDYQLNCLTCVAALGFGDIPADAFLTAIDLLEPTAWIAFNIKEDFMQDRDESGFAKLIRALGREDVIQMQAFRRYQHRISIKGEALYYGAMIATKSKAVPESMKGVDWADT
jgi:hypothetical protein